MLSQAEGKRLYMKKFRCGEVQRESKIGDGMVTASLCREVRVIKHVGRSEYICWAYCG